MGSHTCRQELWFLGFCVNSGAFGLKSNDEEMIGDNPLIVLSETVAFFSLKSCSCCETLLSLESQETSGVLIQTAAQEHV